MLHGAAAAAAVGSDKGDTADGIVDGCGPELKRLLVSAGYPPAEVGGVDNGDGAVLVMMASVAVEIISVTSEMVPLSFSSVASFLPSAGALASALSPAIGVGGGGG